MFDNNMFLRYTINSKEEDFKMQSIELSFDEDLLNASTSILENVGMDIQTIAKVLLTRIVREGSVSFLFEQKNQELSNVSKEQETISNAIEPDGIKMTKSRAKRLFANANIEITDTVTFASKNRAVANYWANPSFDVLKKDYTLILNDVVRKKLILFLIPAYSIKDFELEKRRDRPELIDLQIAYNDRTYTDARSGYSFSKFFVKEISYE